MLDVIFTTKNRPMQVEFAIRSFFENFATEIKDFNATLIYTYDDEYKAGYDLLLKYLSKYRINLVKETEYKKNIFDALDSTNNKYVLFFDDDTVVFKKAYGITKLINHLDQNNEIWSICTFIGKQITGEYGSLHETVLPDFKDVIIDDHTFLKWNWVEARQGTNFSFPNAYAYSIFRKDIWVNSMRGANFNRPLLIECNFNAQRRYDIPWILCFEKSIACSSPLNSVTITEACLNIGTYEYSLENLNNLFISGKVIDELDIYGMDSWSPHNPILFKFKDNIYDI